MIVTWRATSMQGSNISWALLLWFFSSPSYESTYIRTWKNMKAIIGWLDETKTTFNTQTFHRSRTSGNQTQLTPQPSHSLCQQNSHQLTSIRKVQESLQNCPTQQPERRRPQIIPKRSPGMDDRTRIQKNQWNPSRWYGTRKNHPDHSILCLLKAITWYNWKTSYHLPLSCLQQLAKRDQKMDAWSSCRNLMGHWIGKITGT